MSISSLGSASYSSRFFGFQANTQPVISQDVIGQHLKNAYPGYPWPEDFFDKISNIMAHLNENQGRRESVPVGDKHVQIIFTNRYLYLIKKPLGKGTYSRVYDAVEISSDRSYPQEKAIKISKKPFDSEIEMLRSLSPTSQSSPYIDHFQQSYSMDNGRFVGVCDRSEGDFCHLDYTAISIDCILDQLDDVLRGVASFHRSNMAVRDIKGPNMLFNRDGFGKITDFGFVGHLDPKKSKHYPLATSIYAAPYIWDSLFFQKSPTDSCGYQGKTVDLFAIGRTLHLDVICRWLLAQAKQYNLIKITEIVNKDLWFQKRTKKIFTFEDLKAFEETYPKGVFYQKGNLPQDKECVCLFKTPGEMLEKTHAALDLLEGYVSLSDLFKLKRLAELACDLQSTDEQELLRNLNVEYGDEGDLLIQAARKRLTHIRYQFFFKRQMFAKDGKGLGPPPIAYKRSKFQQNFLGN